MMPGITPSLLLTGAPAITGWVNPGSAAWNGETLNYWTDLYAEHTGGTAPFTYAWSSDGFSVTIDNPALRLARFRSSDGSAAAVECLITDALGQQVTISGTILGVVT